MNDYLFRYYALLLNSVLLITTSCYCCIMMMTCKVIGPSQIHTHPSIFGSPLPGSPHFVAIVAVLRLRAHFDLIDLQMAFVPFEGGILEFGTSSGRSTADWKDVPQVRAQITTHIYD